MALKTFNHTCSRTSFCSHCFLSGATGHLGSQNCLQKLPLRSLIYSYLKPYLLLLLPSSLSLRKFINISFRTHMHTHTQEQKFGEQILTFNTVHSFILHFGFWGNFFVIIALHEVFTITLHFNVIVLLETCRQL